MFNKNSVVCCLGASTTEHGFWIYDLNAYFSQERPNDNVVFYNCGAGGNTARVVPTLLESDVMWIDPDYVIICYGGNDIGLFLYDSNLEVTNEVLEQRKKRIVEYEENMRLAAKLILKRGKIPILVAAPTYDDAQEGQPNRKGVAEALVELSYIVQKIADEIGCPMINFCKASDDAKKTFAKNGERVYADDRVHLNRVGQGLMAFTVLKDMGYEVELPKSIEEWEKMRPYETKANNRRFCIEKKLREISYIDNSWFNPLWKNAINEEDKIEKLLTFYTNPETPQWRKQYILHWFQYRNKIEELRLLLVNETNNLVGSEREALDANVLLSGLVFHSIGKD
ncbi:MAG: GDSL-type esterase/lipase family protein [Clostridia bacterium]|nr:GDSL-type esterase/lipase family protein [Clostridia bacterium]